MKLLVLGAGGIGGYFGGRLAEAGTDVTFLVRPKRRDQLARDGLRIQSPVGDSTLQVNTFSRRSSRPTTTSFCSRARHTISSLPWNRLLPRCRERAACCRC